MNQTVKNILYFLTAIVLAKFIGIFKSFSLAKILEPSNYGVWITLLLIYSYSGITTLGTIEALLKQIPFHIGKKEINEVNRIENTTLFAISLSAFITGLISLIVIYTVPSISSSEFIPIIRFMIVTTIIGYFSTYSYFRLSAYQKFKLVSIVDTLRAFLTFSLQVSFSILWGLKGAVIGFMLNETLICLFSSLMGIKHLGFVKYDFDFRYVKRLVTIGFPITIVRWFFIIQTSFDRLIIASLLGKTAVGYYGLGVAITSIFILIPQAIAKVLYPKINERFGKNLNKQDLIPLIKTPTNLLCIFIPIIISIIVFVLPFIYFDLLSKYRPGLFSARILVLGTYFSSLLRNGTNFLIATNQSKLYLRHVTISFIFNILGNYTLIKLGYSIGGVAVSTVLSVFILNSLVWVSVYKNLGYDRFRKIYELFKLYIPFIYLSLLILLFRLIIKNYLITNNFKSFLYCALLLSIYTVLILVTPLYRAKMKEIYNLIKMEVKKRVI